MVTDGLSKQVSLIEAQACAAKLDLFIQHSTRYYGAEAGECADAGQVVADCQEWLNTLSQRARITT